MAHYIGFHGVQSPIKWRGSNFSVSAYVNRLVPHFVRTWRYCSKHLCPASVKSEGVLLFIHYKRVTISNSFVL